MHDPGGLGNTYELSANTGCGYSPVEQIQFVSVSVPNSRARITTKEIQVRKLFSTRRRLAIAAATTALALAGGTAAYAYFTSTGSGTGSATVGTAGTWTVTAGEPSGGPLYPGSGSEVIEFTVTNSGSGDEEFSAATPTVPVYDSTTDAETSADDDISGCTATWFSVEVSSDPDMNTEIGPGDSVDVDVTVTLTDADTDQDACEDAAPAVLLSIS